MFGLVGCVPSVASMVLTFVDIKFAQACVYLDPMIVFCVRLFCYSLQCLLRASVVDNLTCQLRDACVFNSGCKF